MVKYGANKKLLIVSSVVLFCHEYPSVMSLCYIISCGEFWWGVVPKWVEQEPSEPPRTSSQRGEGRRDEGGSLKEWQRERQSKRQETSWVRRKISWLLKCVAWLHLLDVWLCEQSCQPATFWSQVMNHRKNHKKCMWTAVCMQDSDMLAYHNPS